MFRTDLVSTDGEVISTLYSAANNRAEKHWLKQNRDFLFLRQKFGSRHFTQGGNFIRLSGFWTLFSCV